VSPLPALTEAAEHLNRRARQMRAGFDAGFAEPPVPPPVGLRDVLVIRTAGVQRAIALDEVSGVSVRPEISALPSLHPAMLGVVNDRGQVAAVWDLGRLLGNEPETPYWMVVPSAERALAISFERFVGLRRLDARTLSGDLLLPLDGLISTVRELVTGIGSERPG